MIQLSDRPVKKQCIHIVHSEYQLRLLAEHAFGENDIAVHLDTKFNLAGGNAVVLVFRHPCILSRRTGEQKGNWARDLFFARPCNAAEQEAYWASR